MLRIIRFIVEILRKCVAIDMMKRYNRFLPLDEMLLNRWEKAKQLGIDSSSSIYENAYIYGKPKIGKNVWIGPFCIIDATGGLEIGDNVDISSGVMIFTHSTHLRALSGGKMHIVRKGVRVESNVYIGSGAIILPGVTIGHHSIVAAGAVVTKNVPPFSIVAGVPAKRIGEVVLKEDGLLDIKYYR